MTFGLTVVSWYLRLNGFFTLPDAPLADARSPAAGDLLAVRFPHVRIADDGAEAWDPRFEDWGLAPGEGIIGLVAHVTTAPSIRASEVHRAFDRARLLTGLRRLGFWPESDAATHAAQFAHTPVLRVDGIQVGKLLVATDIPTSSQLGCATATLADIDAFVGARLSRDADGAEAGDDVVRYLMWKARSGR